MQEENHQGNKLDKIIELSMKFIHSSIQCVMNKLCDTDFNMVHKFHP